ncbi:MAG: cytochrome c [Gemmatimonadaceae bacterium]|nr:cytochrome c [Gemmatimonadaceae bacterium]
MSIHLSPLGTRRIALGVLCVCAPVVLLGLAPVVGDGVYTKEQADRGRVLYDGTCADCHGAKLEGGTSTPLAGSEFMASWGKPALTLDDFFYIVRKTMPKDKPGSLTREAYTDVVAFILQQNDFPPGEKELSADPELMKAVRFVSPAPPAPRTAARFDPRTPR